MFDVDKTEKRNSGIFGSFDFSGGSGGKHWGKGAAAALSKL